MPTLHSVYLDLEGGESDHRILLDDGDIESGYELIGFKLIPFNGGAVDVRGVVIHTQENGVAIQTSGRFNINRNDQVAFAFSDGTSAIIQTFIKLDTVIVQDLFLSNLSPTEVNIELTFVKSKIGAAMSIVSLLRERSQGALV